MEVYETETGERVQVSVQSARISYHGQMQRRNEQSIGLVTQPNRTTSAIKAFPHRDCGGYGCERRRGSRVFGVCLRLDSAQRGSVLEAFRQHPDRVLVSTVSLEDFGGESGRYGPGYTGYGDEQTPSC